MFRDKIVNSLYIYLRNNYPSTQPQRINTLLVTVVRLIGSVLLYILQHEDSGEHHYKIDHNFAN